MATFMGLDEQTTDRPCSEAWVRRFYIPKDVLYTSVSTVCQQGGISPLSRGIDLLTILPNPSLSLLAILYLKMLVTLSWM